jgi:hypothetical protein
MAKIIFIIFIIFLFLESCAGRRKVYEANYYSEIENVGTEIKSDYIFIRHEDTICWDWYKKLPVFKELMPKSDSVVIKYWGTFREWKAVNREWKAGNR